ncbi:probable serine incorporator isoform X1 [Herrania umbratica]|uniref:Probable serine incorporator isoform X1 n=2 Tax=Herrania umbratica TaxID=108875 RepID=A0A6J1AW48_9ROSI|nr:probable serine incorporator isoform X1 [Herrania umbratica]
MSGSAAAVEASVLHISSSNSQLVQRVKASMEPTNVDCSAERKKSLRARYFYGLIFFIINLTAWFIRDYGQSVLPRLYYRKACGVGGSDCFHTMGVLRVSLGCFIFFFLMFLTTFSTRKLFETCSKWHSGWWALKFVLLVVSIVVPFFLPPDFIQIYGEVARIGAGIFLLLQLISVIEFIGWWNNNWAPDEQRKRSCFFALFTSTIFYVASICGIVSMYYFYAPRPACSLNIFFITWTAILLIVMMAMSLHSKVNRGLLSSGIMASYVVFLCWSAIRSEPADEKCKLEKPKDGHGDWTTILGFLIAIGAIVMATFSTGIDSKSFQFRKDEVKLEDDIRYNYGFFHMIFSLGAMYFAMLFISWNLENSARKWSIDVGWTSTWVKIINEWFAATIYMWKLIAPVVKQPRVINHEESVQQINDSTLP